MVELEASPTAKPIAVNLARRVGSSRVWVISTPMRRCSLCCARQIADHASAALVDPTKKMAPCHSTASLTNPEGIASLRRCSEKECCAASLERARLSGKIHLQRAAVQVGANVSQGAGQIASFTSVRAEEGLWEDVCALPTRVRWNVAALGAALLKQSSFAR